MSTRRPSRRAVLALLGAAVVLVVVALGAIAFVAADRSPSPRARGANGGQRDPLACSDADRAAIIEALERSPVGAAPDVARRIDDLRCRGDFAHGRTCALCSTPPPGAVFDQLFHRSADGTWRHLGGGDPAYVERLAGDAGLARSDLDQLRRGLRASP